MSDKGIHEEGITIEDWDQLKQPEDPVAAKERFAKQWEESKKRIDTIMYPNEGYGSTPREALTSLYGVSKEQLQTITPHEVEERVREMVSRDLLMISYFTPEGDESMLFDKVREQYPTVEIDLDDYKPLAKSWHAAKKMIAGDRRSRFSDHDEFMGQLVADNEKIDDPIVRYNVEHPTGDGAPALLSVPYVIDVQSRINIRSQQGDFIEPFGGSMAERVVFQKV